MSGESLLSQVIIYGTGVPTKSFLYEEISRIEKFWKKGDHHSKNPNSLVHENDGCSVRLNSPQNSEEAEFYELDEILSDFENLIPSVNKMKNELTDDFDVTLSLVIRLHEDHAPAVHFDPRIIALMSKINCGIDIDIYSL